MNIPECDYFEVYNGLTLQIEHIESIASLIDRVSDSMEGCGFHKQVCQYFSLTQALRDRCKDIDLILQETDAALQTCKPTEPVKQEGQALDRAALNEAHFEAQCRLDIMQAMLKPTTDSFTYLLVHDIDAALCKIGEILEPDAAD